MVMCEWFVWRILDPNVCDSFGKEMKRDLNGKLMTPPSPDDVSMCRVSLWERSELPWLLWTIPGTPLIASKAIAMDSSIMQKKRESICEFCCSLNGELCEEWAVLRSL